MEGSPYKVLSSPLLKPGDIPLALRATPSDADARTAGGKPIGDGARTDDLGVPARYIGECSLQCRRRNGPAHGQRQDVPRASNRREIHRAATGWCRVGHLQAQGAIPRDGETVPRGRRTLAVGAGEYANTVGVRGPAKRGRLDLGLDRQGRGLASHQRDGRRVGSRVGEHLAAVGADREATGNRPRRGGGAVAVLEVIANAAAWTTGNRPCIGWRLRRRLRSRLGPRLRRRLGAREKPVPRRLGANLRRSVRHGFHTHVIASDRNVVAAGGDLSWAISTCYQVGSPDHVGTGRIRNRARHVTLARVRWRRKCAIARARLRLVCRQGIPGPGAIGVPRNVIGATVRCSAQCDGGGFRGVHARIDQQWERSDCHAQAAGLEPRPHGSLLAKSLAVSGGDGNGSGMS